MNQPLLHERTKSNLDLYLIKPSHGLILQGAAGSGKYFIAQWLAKTLAATSFTVEPEEDKQTIAINQIRELYRQTRTGNNLCIIIKDADTMGKEAQNAFLKLLEEPPKNTKFILTVNKNSSLLPTLRSRCQLVEIHSPKSSVITDYLTNNGAVDNKLSSLLLTTENKMGKLTQLLQNNDEKEKHLLAVEEVKLFYTGSSYERHVFLIKIQFDVVSIKNLLNTLAILIQTLLRTNAQNSTLRFKLLKQAELVENTSNALFTVSGNPKIQLTKLANEL